MGHDGAVQVVNFEDMYYFEWVQVTSDHMANHYTMLTVQGAAKPATSMP